MAFGKPYVFEDAARKSANARGDRRLMPSAMANRLRDTIRSGLGIALTIIIAAIWLRYLQGHHLNPNGLYGSIH